MPALRHLIEALLNPMMIVLVLLIFVYFVMPKQQSSKRARLLLLVVIGLIYLLSSGFVARGLTVLLEDKRSPVLEVDKNIHFIVVLGGGHSRGNQPANDLLTAASLSRLVEGLRLYRLLPEAKLILSGGAYDTLQSEAYHMAILAAWFAVPAADIALEETSINTADQAIAIEQFVKDAPFYLVTSANHMPRALALFKKRHLHAIPAPTDFTNFWYDERWEKMIFPNAKNIVYVSIIWREYLGYAWACLSNQL